MESLSVSEFKAKCLSVLQDVSKQKKRIIITKRGKPFAEVIPHESKEKFAFLSQMQLPHRNEREEPSWDKHLHLVRALEGSEAAPVFLF